MNTLQLLPLIVVIAFFSVDTDAVDCWKCDKNTQTGSKRCNDVSTLTKTNSAEYSDCGKMGSTTTDKFCKKTVLGNDVFLGCQSDNEMVSQGCYRNKDDTVCFCNAEGCNPASATAPALLLVTVFGIFTMFFVY